MPPIEDHSYLKVCAELASCLSISIASARRRVDLAAAQNRVKDLPGRKAIAEKLLAQARTQIGEGELATSAQFDQLLEALAEDENFMVED